MKRYLLPLILLMSVLGVGVSPAAAETVEYVISAMRLDAGGGSDFFWGPVASQSSISMSGSANNNYPQMFAEGAISGNGGGVYPNYCSPGPSIGPGAVIYPSAVPVYQWYCHYDVPNQPAIDIAHYRALAQSQGNSCNGGPCYNSASSAQMNSVYDTSCMVGADTKVWFYEGSVDFTGGTYFCGILIALGDIKFTGGGAGNTTVAPPANAWKQYQVDTPDGAAHPQGDTSAQDEYPGDAGFHAVKPYNFATGGGGYTGKPVTFHGYLYAAAGYEARGGNLFVGIVQQGPDAPSSTGGGNTIFFAPQTVFTGPPPPPPPGTVATPVITPHGGNFNAPVSVTIQDATPGASIFYTLEGSTPSQNSTLYTGPVTLSSNTIVKAIGILAGMNNSAVASAAFTFISVPRPPPPSLTVSVVPSAVVLGPNQTQAFNALVSGSGVTNRNVTWSISPNVGSLSVNSSTHTVYTAPASVSSQQTVTLTAVSQQDNFTRGTAVITLSPTGPPPPTASADVSIAKSANPDPVTTGQNLTYTLTIGNAGPDIAETVVVTDTLPGSVNLVSRTPSQGSCSTSGQTVSCSLGNVASGAGAAVTIVVTPSVAGTLTNNASVTSAAADPNTGDNFASVTSNVLSSGGNNPVPTLISLAPSSATAGGTGFTLTANGNNFINGSILRWNGSDRTTVFVNSAQVTASIPASDIANAGSANITLFNPAPGGGISNVLTFTINHADGGGAPVLTRIVVSPSNATVLAGGTQGFSAQAFDQNDDPMSGVTFNWSVSGSTQNFVNPAAGNSTTFTAGQQVGAFLITARNGAVSGSAAIEIQTAGGCVLDHVTVAPQSITISPSQTAQFQATAYDSCGQTVPGVVFGWQITTNGGDGSTVSSSGLFTPGQSLQSSLQYTVTASFGGMSDQGQVTVLAGSGSGAVDLTNAKAYPVPYKSTSGSPGIRFADLAPGTTIRLFNMEGRLVQTLHSPSGAAVLWPVTNSSGERVASGVYFYVLDAADHTKKGKLVIIQ